MKANTIISDEMTLDEKLAAIDAAMAVAVASANEDSSQTAQVGKLVVAAPVDPSEMFMCVGCQ